MVVVASTMTDAFGFRTVVVAFDAAAVYILAGVAAWFLPTVFASSGDLPTSFSAVVGSVFAVAVVVLVLQL